MADERRIEKVNLFFDRDFADSPTRRDATRAHYAAFDAETVAKVRQALTPAQARLLQEALKPPRE